MDNGYFFHKQLQDMTSVFAFPYAAGVYSLVPVTEGLL